MMHDMLSQVSEEQLSQWREEQCYVASNIIVLEDKDVESSCCKIIGCETSYDVMFLDGPGDLTEKCQYYGGVDVSFPPGITGSNNAAAGELQDDPAVAVYAILNENCETIYLQHEFFHPVVPYISSYLAFREIDPLVSKKGSL